MTCDIGMPGATENSQVLGVKDEYYGGNDLIRMGGFYELGGQLKLSADHRYLWFTKFALTPLTLGRLGYKSKQHIVESSLGWTLQVGGFMAQPIGDLQFGGAAEVSEERLTLDNGRRPYLQDFRLVAMAKFNY